MAHTISMEQTDVMELAVEIGTEMLKNGGEIYRTEDTMIYILRAFAVEDAHVYVLSNGIFVSAASGKISLVRHVSFGEVNLERISLLNQLARDISGKRCGLSEAYDRLERCRRTPGEPLGQRMLFCGLGCSAFCILFGGGLWDAAATFGIGLCLEGLLYVSKNAKAARFIRRFFFAVFITALGLLPGYFGLPVQQDKIVTAGMLPLLPGVAFTTSVRDFCNGDYLSGVIHMVDALLIAFAVAAGVGIVLGLQQ